jgi:TolA-binding protein
MLNVLAWLEIHRGKLLGGFILFLAVVGATYLWRHFSAQRALEANAALLELRPPILGVAQEAAGPDDYVKVAEAHSVPSVAARARLLAGGAYFSQGRYAEAATEFEKVLQSGVDGILAPQAAYGIAASLDAQDKLDQAIAQYQRVISEYPQSSVAAQARLSLARIHEERGQPEAALRLYDELIQTTQPGPFSDQAETLRQALLRSHPELSGTGGTPTEALQVN